MVAKVTNNAISLVPNALASTATTITLTSGDGSKFPALGVDDFFFLTLIDVAGNFEIVKVTTRVDDTLTVTRGQEGTLAIPFPANSRAELRVTAASVSVENQNVLLL